VQLLDAEGNVIADSGLPDQHDVRLIYSNDEIRLPVAEQYSFLPLDQTPSSPGEYVAAGILSEVRSEDGGFTIRLEDAAPGNDVFMAPAPSFGFGATQSIAFQGVRSAQVARTAVFDQDNQLLYDVLLSQGPAYGQAILRSVFGGWLVASAFAIVLAAATGWIISRRISAPLVALTSVTGRMAQGDLSARACDRIGRGWLPRPLVQRNGKPR
jgi:methyl-accepting chemotaxis protein